MSDTPALDEAPDAPARASRLTRGGRVLLAVTVLVVVVTLLVDGRVPADHRRLLVLDPGWVTGPAGLSMVLAGVVVLARRPGNRVGAVLAGFGLWWAVDGLAAAWLAYATLSQPVLPGATFAFTAFQRLGAGLLLALPLVLVLFPDGRWPRGRLGWVAGASVVMSGLLPLLLLTVPSRVAQPVSGAGALPEPLTRIDLDPVTLPLPDDLWAVLLRVAYLLLPGSLLPALAVVVVRYRRATGLRRTQLRWLLWAAVVDALVMLTLSVVPEAGTVGLTAAVAITSGTVALALVAPERFDVDRVLGTTLVAAVPVVTTVVLDLFVLGATSWVVGGRATRQEVLLVAVVVAVAAWLPLRERLTRRVRRLVGGREDPYDVVSGLARRLEDTGRPEDGLLEVARTVARAMRVRWAGVEVAYGDGRTVLVEHGARPEATRALPVTYRGEPIGRLLLPAGRTSVRLRPAQERLLADVVRQAAAAVRTTLLADELQRSREELVTAVEDERRRLRRDLHDGLGPMLAAVATRIDTARIQGRRDPEAADSVLVQARSDVGGMLTEVRRLVHGLRPPALDDVGLVGAIGQQARAAASGVEVTVDAGEGVDALPAAVEVAAYRIVAEALTNVGRHSGARSATVALRRRDDALVVEVRDDGRGIPSGTPAGVGLVALRERAAELGGSCVVTSDAAGTTVSARLPVASTRSGPPVAGRSSVPAGRGEEAP